MLCRRPTPAPLRPLAIVVTLSLISVLAGSARAQSQSPSGLHQLLPGAQDDGAGAAVAIDSDLLVAGVPGDDSDATDAGAARVYVNLGGTWVLEQSLAAGDAAAGIAFGTSVAIDGNVVAIGAPGDDEKGADAGAVYVFRRINGVWTQEQKLVASDGAAGDRMGSAVALAEDRILTGASGEDGVGAAYFFGRLEGVWIEEQRVTVAGLTDDARFGEAVAVVGNHALVGAPGHSGVAEAAGSVYALQRVGGEWVEEERLTPENLAAGDAFGSAVAITATGRGLVGAPGADRLEAADCGAVYAFERLEGVWLQQQDIFPAAPRSGDAIGTAVAVDGEVLAVGAPGDDDWGDDSGGLYVLALQDGRWLQQAKVAATDAAEGDRLGSVAAVSAPAVVAGAPTDDVDELVDAGTVWVFAFTAPEAPRRFRARRTDGSTTLDLQWRDRSTSETRFEIHRAEANGGAFAHVATVAADATAFTDEGLEPRTRYCYEVAAVNAFGESTSNLSCARTRKARPRPPRRLEAAGSASAVDLSWRDRSDNEDGFVILRKVPGQGPFSDLATVGADVTSFTDEDVTEGTRYCYRVKAHNEIGGRSASSNRDCATPADS